MSGLAVYSLNASFVFCYDVDNPSVYSCAETFASLHENLIFGSMSPFTFDVTTLNFCPNAYSTTYVPVAMGLSSFDKTQYKPPQEYGEQRVITNCDPGMTC